MDRTFSLIRQSQEGEKWAKEQLIMMHSGLIWNVVRRFMGRGIETEDLYQLGAIGLIRAIDKFDFAYDVRFSTYAVPLISGEIKRFLRDDGMIKVSRSLKENQWKIKRAVEAFQRETGREPAIEEIAKELGLEINTWTVNDENSMRILGGKGIDGIITNYPDVAKRVLTEIDCLY